MTTTRFVCVKGIPLTTSVFSQATKVTSFYNQLARPDVDRRQEVSYVPKIYIYIYTIMCISYLFDIATILMVY